MQIVEFNVQELFDLESFVDHAHALIYRFVCGVTQ